MNAEILPRRISRVLAEVVGVEPVVALHGPRSVGKSTVLHEFAGANLVEVFDLDDDEVRDAVVGNLGAVMRGPNPLCLDEYQRLPQVLDGIKARLNRDGSQPGTAVITGSTRQDALPTTAQALTGRLHKLTIWPLSQGEIDGQHETTLSRLLADAATTVAAMPNSPTQRPEYVERVCRGGMPLAIRRQGQARARWFDDFVEQSVERDAVELGNIRHRRELLELLRQLTASTGQILNLSKTAEQVGMPRKSAETYLRLLEDLFLLVRLEAWGKSLRTRVNVKPKIHVVDSGLAARLLRLTPDKLAGLDPTSLTEFGHLLETFVIGEVRKQISWLDEPVALGHWRTSDGTEVDLVLERDDGKVLALEVKANDRALAKDFTGLERLRDLLGDQFLGGVVLTTGRRPYTYDDRLHVMPIDRLWSTADGLPPTS